MHLTLEAAVRQVLGNGLLQERRGGKVQRVLELNDLLAEFAGDDPADAVRRREHLREGGAVNDQALAVVSLDCAGAGLAEVQVADGVILDERHIVFLNEGRELLFLRLGHDAAARVVAVRVDVNRLDRVRLQGGTQRVRVNTFIGRRDLNRPQTEFLQDLQHAEIAGRFHRHQVAGVADNREGDEQSFVAAGGHDDVVRLGRRAGEEHMLRQLQAELRRAFRRTGDLQRNLFGLQEFGGDVRKLRHRQQALRRNARPQRDQRLIARVHQHHAGHVRHFHMLRGGELHRFVNGVEILTGGDIITGLRFGDQVSAEEQLLVGFHHRHDADAAGFAHVSNGRQLLPGLVDVFVNILNNIFNQLYI